MGVQCARCWVFMVFRVLSVQAAAVYRGFRVLGVQGAGYSRFSVFRVLGVQGAACSGRCVFSVFRVFRMFRPLGCSGGLGCWVFRVATGY